MKENIIAAFLLAIGIGISGFFVGHAISSNQTFNKYVSVKGLAEKIVKSNQAVWQIQFTYADNKLADLYKGVEQQQQASIAFLAKQGFKPDEITMRPISIVDNEGLSYSSNSKAKRYTANTGTTLTTNQVDLVRESVEKIGELVKSGVVINNSHIKYMFSKLNEVKPGMLDSAIINAKKAAQTFAKNSDSRLGTIRKASQGVFSINAADDSYNQEASLMKKVRVVTSIEYFLK